MRALQGEAEEEAGDGQVPVQARTQARTACEGWKFVKNAKNSLSSVSDYAYLVMICTTLSA